MQDAPRLPVISSLVRWQLLWLSSYDLLGSLGSCSIGCRVVVSRTRVMAVWLQVGSLVIVSDPFTRILALHALCVLELRMTSLEE